LAELGIEELLIVSSQTSRATFFTIEVLPFAASAQASSSFSLAPEVSFVSAWMICLHSSTAAFTSGAAFAGSDVAGVEDVPLEEEEVLDGVDVLDDEALLGVLVELLPQPAMTSRQAARQRSVAISLRVMCPPLKWKTAAPAGRPHGRQIGVSVAPGVDGPPAPHPRLRQLAAPGFFSFQVLEGPHFGRFFTFKLLLRRPGGR
jgi:hypothetical protein